MQTLTSKQYEYEQLTLRNGRMKIKGKWKIETIYNIIILYNL